MTAVRDAKLSDVVISSGTDGVLPRTLIQRLRESGVRVSVSPSPELSHMARPRRKHLNHEQVIELLPRTRASRLRAAKRTLDVVGAVVGLIVFAPLGVLIAIAIRLDSPGSVFFRQRRVGLDERRFGMLKFRTMVPGAEAQRAALLAKSRDPGWLYLEHDPRVTHVGRLLRRWSIDEVPQLWNVLRGEMSLVGPRPLIEEEGENIPTWARARAEVRPGMTGPWQVMGRTSMSFSEMLVLDWAYAVSHSLRADLILLLRTIPALVSGKGAN